MKIALNNDELRKLVEDLKAGKTWEEAERELAQVLEPGVLEASDYKAWAHREAGLELPEAEQAAAEEQEQAEAEQGEDESPRRGRGRARR